MRITVIKKQLLFSVKNRNSAKSLGSIVCEDCSPRQVIFANAFNENVNSQNACIP